MSIDEIDDDFIRRLENSVICDESDQSASREETPRPGDGDALTSCSVELSGAEPKATYSTLQRNAAVTRDFTRTILRPVVVTVHIEGHPARALIDTGSLADFMSVTLAEQLRVKRVPLAKPLMIQLAVQGSRSSVPTFASSTREPTMPDTST